MVASGKLANYAAATNMKELIWDTELAEFAQNYANTCKNINYNLGYLLFLTLFSSQNKFRSIKAKHRKFHKILHISRRNILSLTSLFIR
jgi:hypothetical protein